MDEKLWSIGAGSFFNAFFSTVSVRLEPAGWGTRFPVVMGDLYAGELTAERAGEASNELHDIRSELRRHPPSHVVWDVQDRDMLPPWGDNIADHITDLGNYFVTDDGRPLLDVLDEAVRDSARSGHPLRVQ